MIRGSSTSERRGAKSDSEARKSQLFSGWGTGRKIARQERLSSFDDDVTTAAGASCVFIPPQQLHLPGTEYDFLRDVKRALLLEHTDVAGPTLRRLLGYITGRTRETKADLANQRYFGNTLHPKRRTACRNIGHIDRTPAETPVFEQLVGIQVINPEQNPCLVSRSSTFNQKPDGILCSRAMYWPRVAFRYDESKLLQTRNNLDKYGVLRD